MRRMFRISQGRIARMTQLRAVVAITRDELAILLAWFETVELPTPPFRPAPWVEVQNPEPWRQVILGDLRQGPIATYWHTALNELRWFAKRFAPPEVQAAARTGELVEQRGRPF
jgi:hypothetical protein